MNTLFSDLRYRPSPLPMVAGVWIITSAHMTETRILRGRVVIKRHFAAGKRRGRSRNKTTKTYQLPPIIITVPSPNALFVSAQNALVVHPDYYESLLEMLSGVSMAYGVDDIEGGWRLSPTPHFVWGAKDDAEELLRRARP